MERGSYISHSPTLSGRSQSPRRRSTWSAVALFYWRLSGSDRVGRRRSFPKSCTAQKLTGGDCSEERCSGLKAPPIQETAHRSKVSSVAQTGHLGRGRRQEKASRRQ